MELAEQLFIENNELRAKLDESEKCLHAKCMHIDMIEEEIWTLKASHGISANSSIGGLTQNKPVAVGPNVIEGLEQNHSLHRDLEDAINLIEKKESDILRLKDELEKSQSNNASLNEIKELTEVQQKLIFVEAQRNDDQRKKSVLKEAPKPVAQKKVDISPDREKLIIAETTINNLKKQMIDVSIEANKSHSELQSKIQNYDGLLDGLKAQYEEFTLVSSLESDSYKVAQKMDFDFISNQFNAYKLDTLEDKRKLGIEFKNAIMSIQCQSEEYRIAQEYIFNLEASKFQDLLSSQALRYEQEILYIIQIKDKVYAEMMIAKDGKIMSLIEGSDLQTLIQRNEMDMENLRKEHQKDIELMKSEEESEQKNTVTLLNRQNQTLETKYDKLQSQLRSMEPRMKELLTTIESKNRHLLEKDEERFALEKTFKTKVEDFYIKIATLSQEKDKLRHKVIRAHLRAKGDSDNSIESESADLTGTVNKLRSEQENTAQTYAQLERQHKSSTREVAYLEKQITKKSEEYTQLTRTFEEFLKLRSKAFQQEKMLKSVSFSERMDDKFKTKDATERVGVMMEANRRKSLYGVDAVKNTEFEKGLDYLKRFKSLSGAYKSGSYKLTHYKGKEDPSLEESVPIYATLNEMNSKIASIYRDLPKVNPQQVYSPKKTAEHLRVFDGVTQIGLLLPSIHPQKVVKIDSIILKVEGHK